MKDSPIQAIIDRAYDQYMTMQKGIHESGFDEKYAQMMMNTVDSDEEFLARKVLKMTNLFDEMGNMLQYLHKPVRKEGMLSCINGKYYISGEEIPNGSTIEYMSDGKWNMGRISQHKNDGKIVIITDENKTIEKDFLDLKVRIR